MRIKIRSSAGTAIVDVDKDLLILGLTNLLRENHFKDTQIASYKFGYPPKNIDASTQETIENVGIKPNEQLVATDATGVSGYHASAKTDTKVPPKPVQSDIPSVYIPKQDKYLILRNVPDDNSCLFNSVSLAVTGSIDWKKLDLRRVVAETILSSPETYNEAILGRPVGEYCKWIQKPESWGGAIELGILSKHLGVRIQTYDIDLGSPITFQDEQLPPKLFILLVYSGIHYDTLVTNRSLSKDRHGDLGKWTEDNGITDACAKLVTLLQTKNYATNTTKFRVRCLDCYEILVGETGASQHANKTGHTSFGEVK
ncbi:hypothetical protein PUMCH_001001 [Australozyma saopauloensis]|uniref:Ubiquitin thioesterase OTU n=1 Tax=Australozyma saopauloensis TaxID=291208 RepID=A0AAX4H595_9ASCO|nr:hypothetical protein PUMCH_001001 [[Candida] saopauloensis]